MPFSRGQLLYFVTVADEGQMTRAARRLHLAQPALSQAIAKLEAELGVQLLDRHPRGVTLTPAGEAFLVKARTTLSAWSEAILTAQSFAQSGKGTIEFGFVGSPPGLDSPEVLEAFARTHPKIDVRYRELGFPTSETAAWLKDVDVGVCHEPPPDPGVWMQTLRHEPRVVLAPARHPFAQRERLTVAETLDQTFVGFHASIDPDWAGFWSLDDYRGGPPRHMTADRVANPQEVLAALSMRRAITAVPASVGRVLMNVVPNVVPIPLEDVTPARIVLAGHEERGNPFVAALVTYTRTLRRDARRAD
jgi:DNA-binding transcriptional LysR family regulator